jgi:hypothetical protein
MLATFSERKAPSVFGNYGDEVDDVEHSLADAGGGNGSGVDLIAAQRVPNNGLQNGESSYAPATSASTLEALMKTISDGGAAKREVTYYEKLFGSAYDYAVRSIGCPALTNPFFLDDPDIAGERRRKRLHFRSYLCTVISFADKRNEKKDINQQFFLRHPNLEPRDIKLSHIRSIKTSLLQLCLEETSPVELGTIAFAAWYWERLVATLHVAKQNRKLMVAVCVTLAIKFWEMGNVTKKLMWAWTKMEELFGVDPVKIRHAEFLVFAALDFTLLPPAESDIGRVYGERLLQIMNITWQEYFSKNFDQTILWAP